MKQSNKFLPEVQDQIDGYVEDYHVLMKLLAYKVRSRASHGFLEDEELNGIIGEFSELLQKAVESRDMFIENMQGYRKDK